MKRHVPRGLTPVEAEVMREQGKTIGPVVDDTPVRQMDSTELFRRLVELVTQSETAQAQAREKDAAYLRRQVSKIRKEVERRARGRAA